jgi:Nif-specific regulatory protein
VALAPDGVIRAELFPHRRPREREGRPTTSDERIASLELPLGLPLDEASRRYVEATVEACGGNKTEAAKRLAVGRNSIGRWLKEG